MSTLLKDTKNVEQIGDLIDKLTINALYLMEDKLKCELNIESAVNNGSFHLAKSRYIMGQQSVSAVKLPMENSTEFTASKLVQQVPTENSVTMELINNKEDSTINPIKWFGVLVPQNLYQAQTIFLKLVAYVVELANVQLALDDNFKKINALKSLKSEINNDIVDS